MINSFALMHNLNIRKNKQVLCVEVETEYFQDTV